MTDTESRARDEGLLGHRIWAGKIHSDGWVQGGGEPCRVIDKATGAELGVIGTAAPADVARAAESARRAQRDWYAQAREERTAVFRRAAALVERHREELAQWIMRETGAIRAKADVELRRAGDILNESASMLGEPLGLVLPSDFGRMSFCRRLPHGVVGVIAPFNFPLILAIRAVAPALAAGNAVLLKPDPRTAVVGGVLIQRLFDEAGLPRGLLHTLPGGAGVGEALCTDPNIAMIAFTGSTVAGRRVGELAGRHLKKVSLELGGNNALIVLEDADLELAASSAAFGAWSHQGQVCMTTGRLLVHERIAERLADRLAQKADELRVGDPMSGEVALGPVIDQRQLQRIDAIIHDSVRAGAALRAGGSFENLFYRPTVLTGVGPGMRAFDEEIFGPVAALTTFSSDRQAIELASQTEYGLTAGIISPDISRALALGSQLNVGVLHINDQTVVNGSQVPFGGRGASGNGGSIGGPANWEEFTQWQWVTVKHEPPRYPF